MVTADLKDMLLVSEIKGPNKAIFRGVTQQELARIGLAVIDDACEVIKDGKFHIGPEMHEKAARLAEWSKLFKAMQ